MCSFCVFFGKLTGRKSSVNGNEKTAFDPSNPPFKATTPPHTARNGICHPNAGSHSRALRFGNSEGGCTLEARVGVAPWEPQAHRTPCERMPNASASKPTKHPPPTQITHTTNRQSKGNVQRPPPRQGRRATCQPHVCPSARPKANAPTHRRSEDGVQRPKLMHSSRVLGISDARFQESTSRALSQRQTEEDSLEEPQVGDVRCGRMATPGASEGPQGAPNPCTAPRFSKNRA